MNIPSIITAAQLVGADAIHPGVGFLSENSSFAEIIQAHNIKFIGPKVQHLKDMGDKIKAKEIAQKLDCHLFLVQKVLLKILKQQKKKHKKLDCLF